MNVKSILNSLDDQKFILIDHHEHINNRKFIFSSNDISNTELLEKWLDQLDSTLYVIKSSAVLRDIVHNINKAYKALDAMSDTTYEFNEVRYNFQSEIDNYLLNKSSGIFSYENVDDVRNYLNY